MVLGEDYAAGNGAMRRLENRLSQDQTLKQISKKAVKSWFEFVTLNAHSSTRAWLRL